MTKHLLTKSTYRYGVVCDRFFWIYQNDRDRLPEVDESTQAIFDRGHLIGSLAEAEKKEIQNAPVTYCHQDTEGMIGIIKALHSFC